MTDQVGNETDEERADREETERAHARGDHRHCGVTCEVEMPTEHLRNFVIAKGYPGTTSALAELERRAAAGARQDMARPSTPPCAHCNHPKGDHDGRADHRAKHSPLVAGEPWCHACNAQCDYAATKRQDWAQR